MFHVLQQKARKLVQWNRLTTFYRIAWKMLMNLALLFLTGMVLLLLASCGESDAPGGARTAGALCDEVCGWPDMCFAELGAPIQGDQCVEACVEQVDIVGVDCLAAIADTIACLGTCDVESITQEQALACQDEAERISASCE